MHSTLTVLPWILLFASALALVFGPLAYPVLTRRPELAAALDGFVFVAIGALVLVEVLPETATVGGPAVWVFLLLGLFGPTWLERVLAHAARQTHMATLLLGGFGLVLHTVADGAALHLPESAHASPLLPLAVVLHRIPVGLAIWWLLRPSFGVKFALSAIALMMIGTVVGFAAGPQITAGIDSAPIAWFQAFVAGSILHVVFNKPHLGDEFATDTTRAAPWHEGVGNLIALIGIGGLIILHSLAGADHHGEAAWSGWDTLYRLAWVSAPALLLGFILAGLLGALLPGAPMRWLKRGGSFGQSARGIAIGLPMPVCSCGVLPLYQNLVAKGTPGAAAMAFLIATPELGIDAVILSLPLLGLDMTLLRVGAAVLLALLVGTVIGRMVQAQSDAAEAASAAAPESCCGSGEAPAEDVLPPLGVRIRAGLRQSLTELVESTGPWILLGLVIAAVCEPLLSAPWLTGLNPVVQVLAFALIGIPTYVCAAGATPIVAIMLLAGVSPGAALAFLLAGPATNIATFGLLAQLHGRGVALGFAAATVGGAVALGVLTNLAFDPGTVLGTVPHDHAHPAWWQLASLVVVCGLFLAAMIRKGARDFLGSGIMPHHVHAHDGAHVH